MTFRTWWHRPEGWVLECISVFLLYQVLTLQHGKQHFWQQPFGMSPLTCVAELPVQTELKSTPRIQVSGMLSKRKLLFLLPLTEYILLVTPMSMHVKLRPETITIPVISIWASKAYIWASKAAFKIMIVLWMILNKKRNLVFIYYHMCVFNRLVSIHPFHVFISKALTLTTPNNSNSTAGFVGFWWTRYCTVCPFFGDILYSSGAPRIDFWFWFFDFFFFFFFGGLNFVFIQHGESHGGPQTITAGTAVAMSLIVLVSDPTPHVNVSWSFLVLCGGGGGGGV